MVYNLKIELVDVLVLDFQAKLGSPSFPPDKGHKEFGNFPENDFLCSSEKLAVTKTTSKYIAGLQDPFKDKFMNGKNNHKLKSL